MIKRSPVRRSPVKTDKLIDAVKITTGKSNVATIELVDKDTSNAGLRLLAKMLYVSSPNNISLEKLSEKEPLSGNVSVNTLITWSTKDNWVLERERHRKNLEQAILKKLSDEQIKAISDQLTDLLEIRQRLYETVRDKDVRPNSLEGVANALIRLEQFMLDSRGIAANIFAGSISEAESSSERQAPKSSYPVESLRDAAIAIIKADQKNRKKNEQEQTLD